MKRLFTYLILILTVAMNIFAQGRGNMDGNASVQMDYMMLFDYAGITLTDNQKRTMDGCIGRHNSETGAIYSEIRVLNNNIRDELLKDKPDRKIIKSYIDKKKEKEALIEYMSIERDITIIETLTPEQRRMFYDYQGRMRGRMRHGGGHGRDR